ncbi:hypothetical protein MTR_4g084780 [Medicago truncatula]|uniref:Uncharacterized protein n=1 Tax=Medicago truncatula TaxID=3880 RepID=A0A072UPF0_MEDTR|nr:hypothetical protein MTR_4g084780 [Medicago truncatula]
MPELEQSKKMVNQESFLRQRIQKAKEQLTKQRKDNREKEMTHLMFQYISAAKNNKQKESRKANRKTQAVGKLKVLGISGSTMKEFSGSNLKDIKKLTAADLVLSQPVLSVSFIIIFKGLKDEKLRVDPYLFERTSVMGGRNEQHISVDPYL